MPKKKRVMGAAAAEPAVVEAVLERLSEEDASDTMVCLRPSVYLILTTELRCLLVMLTQQPRSRCLRYACSAQAADAILEGVCIVVCRRAKSSFVVTRSCLLVCDPAYDPGLLLHVQGMDTVHSAATVPQAEPASARSATGTSPVAAVQQDMDMDEAGDRLLAHEALAPAHLDGSCGEAPPAPRAPALSAALPLWESRLALAGTSSPHATAGATASAEGPAAPSAFAMPQTSQVQLFAPPTGATAAYCWA